MIIKLGDIEIYGYDKTDENQRHLKYTLDHDESFRKYVTKHIEERLQETNLGGGYNLILPIWLNIKKNL